MAGDWGWISGVGWAWVGVNEVDRCFGESYRKYIADR